MIDRLLSDEIVRASKQMPVVSITGPRQSGKTTLCRKLFPDHFYANLEHPEVRAFALEDPNAFIQQGKKNGLIIDEAQYAPGLFSYIQIIADETKQSGRFILSGSQNFLLMEKITQSLAGRVAVFHLLPLSLGELKSTQYFPDTPFQYILQGGYPRIYDQQVDLDIFFSSYIQTYIERDIRQLLQVGDLQQFQQFTKICAGRVGQLFNQSAIAGEIGLTHTTIRRWMSVLETSFIIYRLPPYFKNFNKRLIKTPKLYFYDTGLAAYLLGIRSVEELDSHYGRGALFENFVINEFVKSKSADRQSLYFWRDRRGREIDLLIETAGDLFPIEIKSSATFKSEFFKNIKYFNTISGNDTKLSTVIYAGERSYDRSEGKVRSWSAITED